MWLDAEVVVEGGHDLLEMNRAVLGDFTQAVRAPDHLTGSHAATGEQLRHPTLLDLLLDFNNKRAAQKAKYLGEMFIAGMPNGTGAPFLEFFQVEKSSGLAKGILRIALTPPKGATP